MDIPPSQDVNKQNISSPFPLKNALYFMGMHWKTLCFAVLMGLFVSIIAFYLVTPRFEVLTQLQVAQISSSKIPAVKGAFVEDPSVVVSNLRSPSFYDSNILDVCGFDASGLGTVSAVSKFIQPSIPKSLNSSEILGTIDLRLEAPVKSATDAEKCVLAIFEKIKLSEIALVMPLVEDAKAKLAIDELRLLSLRQIVGSTKSDSMTASYLVAREEIRTLTEEMDKLTEVAKSGPERAAKLTAPIYVSIKPVFPSASLFLFAGVFFGLIAGYLYCLLRQVVAKKTSFL